MLLWLMAGPKKKLLLSNCVILVFAMGRMLSFRETRCVRVLNSIPPIVRRCCSDFDKRGVEELSMRKRSAVLTRRD